MIIIESLLTIFEVSSTFEAAEAVSKIGLSLKMSNQVKLVHILVTDCSLMNS